MRLPVLGCYVLAYSAAVFDVVCISLFLAYAIRPFPFAHYYALAGVVASGILYTRYIIFLSWRGPQSGDMHRRVVSIEYLALCVCCGLGYLFVLAYTYQS